MLPKDKLAEYLDEEDEQTVNTPKLGSEGLLETQIRRVKLENVSEFLGKLRLEHPKIFSRLEGCIESLLAVEQGAQECSPMDESDPLHDIKRPKQSSGFHGQSWLALARFIPLRLSGEERRLLALLERTLKVSEYTDNVDIYLSKYNRSEVMRKEVEKIQAILSGQFVAMQMSKSTQALTEEWFGSVFEIARRYKAMNPDRLRETHVKLMFMLQDAKHLVHVPIKTVATILADDELLSPVLSDPLIDEFVHATDPKVAADVLLNKYKSPETLNVLNSIKDYVVLIQSFLRPVTTLLGLMEQHFDPKHVGTHDLSIRAGSEGSRLNHSHAKQYQFVSQSLRLWKEALTYFMPLWLKAEEDLLATDYRLADTGQGLNRVQSAPRTAALMGGIVDKVQRSSAAGWIGSSVVHMGDHNVPNALVFLDKYCQIPRIVGPIAHTLTRLPAEYANFPPVVQAYVDDTFGGVEACQVQILADFCKHAFDGSGADNNYDAGSCIDGRLTSAWNWCSKIEKKSYFPIFLLTNFVGFDGDQQSYTYMLVVSF